MENRIPTEPGLDTVALWIVGRNLGVKSILTGFRHPILQRMCEHAAKYQAEINTQGHHNWNNRFQQLHIAMPDQKTFGEVCAESWEWELDADMTVIAKSMFKSWEQSSGHWAWVNGECQYFGWAMARGSRVWYANGIFAK